MTRIAVDWNKRILVTETGLVARFNRADEEYLHTYLIYNPQGLLKKLKFQKKRRKDLFKKIEAEG